ncbi:hypothetical protein MMC30_008198 [Trapelia coarctata]|nr:hypothetical protein [Trapelia coarctata]
MAAVFEFPFSGANASATTLRGEEVDTMGATFEMMNLKGGAQGIMISVQETPSPPPPAVAQVASSVPVRSASPAAIPPSPPAPIQIAAPPRARTHGSPRPSSPLRISTTPEPPTRATSPAQGSISQQTHRSSPTLVRNGSIASTGTHSPVMRSMFPRFDPALPLTRQNFAPTPGVGPAAWQGEAPSLHSYSPSLYSTPLTTSKSNFKEARAGMRQSPLQNSELAPPNLSSPEQLLDLWSLASGQETEECSETYTLGLRCNDLSPCLETISFTSSASHFYTLSASSTALTITRTHPHPPNTTITVTTTTLATPSPSSPLITSIFPTLAELLAIDHSSSIAVAHALNRKDSADLQAEALLRVRAAEAANLLWDSDSSRYYLIHPTLLAGDPATLPFDVDERACTITLLSSTSPAAQAFLTLSLATNVLTIHAPAIAPLDSPYALDTFVSAILALLLHLHRTATRLTPQLTSGAFASDGQPLNLNFAPPPTAPVAGGSKSKSLRSVKSKAKSKLHSRPQSALTNHTNPISFQDAYLASQSQLQLGGAEADVEQGIAPELRTEGVDLSRFQSYDLNDKSLPAPTRAVLRVVYWFFGVLVWLLGVCVGVIAAGVVGAGKCVSRA